MDEDIGKDEQGEQSEGLNQQQPLCSWSAGPRPSKLYKYRSLVGASLQRIHRLVTESLLWFAPISAFNDPFEGEYAVDPSGNDEERRKMYRQMLLWEVTDLDEGTLGKLTDKMLLNPPPQQDFDAAIVHAKENGRKSVRIFSLTADPADILMWSHYADSHRGICLEFDTTIGDQSPLRDALPVDYQDHFAILNFFADEPFDIKAKAIAFTKAEQWGYEQEWRIVKSAGDAPNSAPLEVAFPIEALTGVILGSQIKGSDEQTVRELFETRGTALYRATRRGLEYAIDLLPGG